MVANRQAQVEEGLAQVVTGDLLGASWSQHPNQGPSALRAVRFYRQIDQESTHLVRFQLGQRRIVQQDMQ